MRARWSRTRPTLRRQPASAMSCWTSKDDSIWSSSTVSKRHTRGSPHTDSFVVRLIAACGLHLSVVSGALQAAAASRHQIPKLKATTAKPSAGQITAAQVELGSRVQSQALTVAVCVVWCCSAAAEAVIFQQTRLALGLSSTPHAQSLSLSQNHVDTRARLRVELSSYALTG